MRAFIPGVMMRTLSGYKSHNISPLGSFLCFTAYAMIEDSLFPVYRLNGITA